MFARKGMFSSAARPVVIAAVAALALSAVAPTMASARPIHRGYHGGGGAAAAAAFAGIVGTGLAIAASRPYNDSYDTYYGPAPVYGGPAYGGPVYYGGGPSYYRGYGGDQSTVPFVNQNGSW